MNMKIAVLNYEAPHVEVVEVMIEQGIATTGNTEGFGPWL